jgi:hypothetical protein
MVGVWTCCRITDTPWAAPTLAARSRFSMMILLPSCRTRCQCYRCCFCASKLRQTCSPVNVQARRVTEPAVSALQCRTCCHSVAAARPLCHPPVCCSRSGACCMPNIKLDLRLLTGQPGSFRCCVLRAAGRSCEWLCNTPATSPPSNWLC